MMTQQFDGQLSDRFTKLPGLTLAHKKMIKSLCKEFGIRRHTMNGTEVLLGLLTPLLDIEKPNSGEPGKYILLQSLYVIRYEDSHMLYVWCPICSEFHSHGIGEGTRCVHCITDNRGGYVHDIYNVKLPVVVFDATTHKFDTWDNDKRVKLGYWDK